MKAGEVRGKRFSVFGGARSGVAVAKLLKRHGARVFLSDKAAAEKMAQVAVELEAAGIDYEFGVNSERVLEGDVVVLSPGVPSDVPLVKESLAKGLKVTSEVEVASWFCMAPIVAITGTNGKTTTTTLTGRMFQDEKRECVVAGNIGTAFSQVVDQVGSDGAAVLEISSFQLDHIESFKPKIAVWLNITPDHLDRYDHSYEKYIESKCRIFKNQTAHDVLIYNVDDKTERSYVEKLAPPSVRKMAFSIHSKVDEGAFVQAGHLRTRMDGREEVVIGTDQISVRGMHNLYNAMAATLAARVMGTSTASIRATLKNFKGVEHRLELIREVNGVAYVNDSKATNVDSVWYALQSFDRPIVLFLGGRDKGNDYSRLTDPVKKHVRAIIAIGESADKVTKAFASIVSVVTAANMEEAVKIATRTATSGDVVLLSPACASFDWFENYEHRGRVFKQLVRELSPN
ncbi:MAG TPA: UDP-N-acetylmuramoyl-L-alanine--D-glutamate ligase [Bacteroidetes bacterium]|nr:UDP-N-acetylmuramoyl-L-alanine--D-glutamate ligase [Bacteroidota bacterium]